MLIQHDRISVTESACRIQVCISAQRPKGKTHITASDSKSAASLGVLEETATHCSKTWEA